MLTKIDWVGDDGLFEHLGRRASIERIGADLYAVSEGDEEEQQTIVGSVALDYWLHRWVLSHDRAVRSATAPLSVAESGPDTAV